jgi:hypothetical protein
MTRLLDRNFMASSVAVENDGNEIHDEVPSMKEYIEQEHNSLINYVNKNGICDYAEFLETRLKHWAKRTLHIALIGSSGQGKHSILHD